MTSSNVNQWFWDTLTAPHSQELNNLSLRNSLHGWTKIWSYKWSVWYLVQKWGFWRVYLQDVWRVLPFDWLVLWYCEVFCENVTLFAYQWHNTSVRQVMFVWTFCLSFIVRGIRKLRVQGALFVTRGLKNTLDPLSNILNYVHSLLCCLTNRKKKNTFSGCTSCSFLWLLGQPSFDIYSMSKSFPRRGPSSL